MTSSLAPRIVPPPARLQHDVVAGPDRRGGAAHPQPADLYPRRRRPTGGAAGLQALLRELRDQKRIRDLLRRMKLFREFDAIYDSQLFESTWRPGLRASPLEMLIEGCTASTFYCITSTPSTPTCWARPTSNTWATWSPTRRQPPKLWRSGPSANRRASTTRRLSWSSTSSSRPWGGYLEEQGYDPSRPLRVLDMACGSGSFLIEAFDVLDRYVAEMRASSTTACRTQGKGAKVRLPRPCPPDGAADPVHLRRG